MTPDFPAPPLTDESEHTVAVVTSTTYRLQREEDPAEGVRRIARARAHHALENLRGDAPVAEAVHNARKDTKKLRSLLRLVRPHLGTAAYRVENDRCRAAARRLSGPRDAEVALGTLDDLRGRYADAPPTEALRRALRDERRRLGGRTLQRRMAEAAELIERTAAGIDDWPLEGEGPDLVHDGLKRSHRRARRAYRAVCDDPSEEAVHAWRKRTKDLWYHARLLRDVDPDLKRVADDADVLSDLLGDHHDLTVLIEQARVLTPDDPDTAPLRAVAERRQDELLQAALPRAERIFARSPKAVVRRIDAAWEDWRAAAAG